MFLSFPLIPLLLFSICLTSIVTAYLLRRVRLPDYFGRVLKFTLSIIFLNSLYSFVNEIYFPDNLWQRNIAPFALLYGPLLYFGIISLRDHNLPTKTIAIHALPFFFFLIYFLLIHSGGLRNTFSGRNLNQELAFACSISFLCYAIVSFLVGKRVFTRYYRDKLLMIVFARIILLFLSIIFLTMGFSKALAINPAGVYLMGIILYCCMLIFVLMVFNFTVNKLLNRFSKSVIEVNDKKIGAQTTKYEKSTLADDQLTDYCEKLEYAMQKEQLFLNVSLSLTTLATHLKIPNHHLTQVLSVKIGQTFYQYVNGYRIAFACDGLLGDKDVKIEDLAEKSGFNSKASFNRQFKIIKGCTPSAYRASVAQTKKI